MNLMHLLADRNFLIALLAAVSAAAAVFTFGTQFIGRSEMKDRIRRVALEREKMRAEEMARLRGPDGGRTSMRREDTSKNYVRQVVDMFNLQRAFVDENTAEKLAMAGYRGPGHMTTYVFFRFVTPIILFALAFFYLRFVLYPTHPLYLTLAGRSARASSAAICRYCCSRTPPPSASNRSAGPGRTASI
jgi:tight adherence protein C